MVNGTGSPSDLRGTTDPLLIALMHSGVARLDKIRLGLDSDLPTRAGESLRRHAERGRLHRPAPPGHHLRDHGRPGDSDAGSSAHEPRRAGGSAASDTIQDIDQRVRTPTVLAQPTQPKVCSLGSRHSYARPPVGTRRAGGRRGTGPARRSARSSPPTCGDVTAPPRAATAQPAPIATLDGRRRRGRPGHPLAAITPPRRIAVVSLLVATVLGLVIALTGPGRFTTSPASPPPASRRAGGRR